MLVTEFPLGLLGKCYPSEIELIKIDLFEIELFQLEGFLQIDCSVYLIQLEKANLSYLKVAYSIYAKQL